ncbi:MULTISPECIES: bifunctional 4-hydroxy-2-oxoglutarate aldolase/2-dehydro-3-deoxy-phosphogluconate aldolase [unclassified Herbaspirillum]|jgi:2-dehydro-3-deoxyphosphogluconate aldolase/(4S)-4-hydroxy-2-oxoglutarate aldolase|uniref:bifunctional 4-hydroxy-2-oxoglutarate aldolase/2-dehydro-3-deoxy-phosphogluconate aldolase n=1 Tax=unclassified Herbaspirillum TaxID=2624150 RepID=UPI000E2EED34|nr:MULTISPECIES: bifunctional 4-hydroxy-2-oxoglutarate aldolase/2-dehydro-3-deoxy-phosphogluconate aldolase [unclassified Herbaspirillum]RFB74123.1 keto-hydroxyglutarate-aldolase/keto-deoxy-phosphogluconate aldolase [Herbaspirillum sp. 3R-3a1]TFI10059.1 bifunctional 4-hydroxy-2-oxoglutarate aldolase/2-dehydro-3-deoxy-phosphogluconate aldolase [Herbaspirillum sp. 3R11]TFI15963.1 bifunctional 4-hydroxy-2-oxoglutarate aldolase/2-dehydro-3-deoxy-phosphogluconate aldolase [Herbaspirillum sp. 3R-11]T
MNILEIMRTSAVIPVIAIDKLEHAVPLAKALVAGGIRVLEVTLRTEHGLPAIRAIAEQVPEAIVGVGTLTSPEEFAASRDAGAVFGVSPGLTAALIAAAKSSGLPLLPGVMTPSEVMAAREAGFRQLKLFPAMQAGGIGMLNAIAGPLGDVTFCPTGGISQETASQFLALKNVACVGGSWLTPKNAIEIGDWHKITALAKAASALRP